MGIVGSSGSGCSIEGAEAKETKVLVMEPNLPVFGLLIFLHSGNGQDSHSNFLNSSIQAFIPPATSVNLSTSPCIALVSHLSSLE